MFSTKKITLYLASLFFVTGIQAQTAYTKFIESKHINWAARHTGPIQFSEINFSLLLRKRFSINEIRGVNPDKLEIENKLEYIIPAEVQTRINPGFGDTLNFHNDPLFSPVYFNADINRQVEVQQVLYVEKGVIKSTVNMVSPQFTVTTPAGTLLGTGKVFTTALNSKKCIKKSIQNKAIFLGTTSVSFETLQLQKQVFGLDLPACIWPGLDSKYEIVRIDSNKTITKDDLNKSLVTVHVPVYDEQGNLEKTAIVQPVLTADSFKVSEIEQEWFYSKKKNILFSRVKSLILNFSTTPLLKLTLK